MSRVPQVSFNSFFLSTLVKKTSKVLFRFKFKKKLYRLQNGFEIELEEEIRSTKYIARIIG